MKFHCGENSVRKGFAAVACLALVTNKVNLENKISPKIPSDLFILYFYFIFNFKSVLRIFQMIKSRQRSNKVVYLT